MTLRFFSAIAALFLCVLSFPALAYDPNPRSEAQMVRDVQVALQFTHKIDTSQLQVFASGPGEVTLSGALPTRQQKEIALKTASRLPGITRVYDQLKVGPQGTEKELALKSAIEQRLLADRRVAGGDIVVHVDGDKVILNGIVSDVRERDVSVHDAFASGARSVTSRIRIRSDLAESSQPRTFDHDPLG